MSESKQDNERGRSVEASWWVGFSYQQGLYFALHIWARYAGC